MYAQIEKQQEKKARVIANSIAQKKSKVTQGFGFVQRPKKTKIAKWSGNETLGDAFWGTKCSRAVTTDTYKPIQLYSLEGCEGIASRVIQRIYAGWGGVNAAPSNQQLTDAVNDILNDFVAGGWDEGQYTVIKTLGVEIQNDVVANLDAHVTFNKTTIKERVRQSLLAGRTRAETLTHVGGGHYHITVESEEGYAANNPRYYSNGNSWERAGGIGLADRNTMNDAANDLCDVL